MTTKAFEHLDLPCEDSVFVVHLLHGYEWAEKPISEHRICDGHDVARMMLSGWLEEARECAESLSKRYGDATIKIREVSRDDWALLQIISDGKVIEKFWELSICEEPYYRMSTK